MKKSLLAKAISNHSESKTNLSMEDLSVASSSSTVSSSSSLSCLASPSSSNKITRTRSLSNLNVSEYEGDVSWAQTSICANCKQKRNNDSKSNTIQEVNNQGDASEMSLMEEDYGEEEQKANNNKRKASLAGSVNDSQNEEPQKDPLLLDTSSKASMNNKKFKSQVTSTPAAGTSVASKLVDTKYQNTVPGLSEGMFFGRGKHSDGSFIKIIFQRRLIALNESENNATDFGDASTIDEDPSKTKLSSLICVWISRDINTDNEFLDFSMDQSVVSFKSIIFRSNKFVN